MAKSICIDISRCTYCRACEIACAAEHKGVALISVALVDGRVAVPINCRQCEKAPCITVCSPKALTKGKDGTIVVDSSKCNSCKFCIMACPFQAIQIDAVNKTVRICDLCPNRTEEGKAPACVATCPTRALTYDDLGQVLARSREKAARYIIRASGLKR